MSEKLKETADFITRNARTGKTTAMVETLQRLRDGGVPAVLMVSTTQEKKRLVSDSPELDENWILVAGHTSTRGIGNVVPLIDQELVTSLHREVQAKFDNISRELQEALYGDVYGYARKRLMRLLVQLEEY